MFNYSYYSIGQKVMRLQICSRFRSDAKSNFHFILFFLALTLNYVCYFSYIYSYIWITLSFYIFTFRQNVTSSSFFISAFITLISTLFNVLLMILSYLNIMIFILLSI
jgi:hypothetical protein